MALKLSPLISDHLVVQRDKPWVLSGLAEPEARLTITFGGEPAVTTIATADGNWQTDLGTFPANSNPQQLRIVCATPEKIEERLVNDIVVGDVWLLSGQSNMELWLSRTAHNYPEVMAQTDDLLRNISIPQIPAYAGPITPTELSACEWKTFSPESAADFSAVGYFFARQLRARYGVPIGLIATAVGGSPIAAWLPRAELDRLGIDHYDADKFANPDAVTQLAAQEQAAITDYQQGLDRADQGLTEHWAASSYDDSDWNQAELTDYAAGSGAHWYRKTLEVPPYMAGRKAEMFLGTAIDLDTIYINGKEIGTTYYRYPPRNYSFTLPEGSITIAIRLVAFSGGGEFTPGKNRFIATDNGIIDLAGPWKYRTGCLVENAPTQTPLFNISTGLYNGLIAPLHGIQIKGIAWYQGETDGGDPGEYGTKLIALINTWRKVFDNPDMPFLVQQLAHWDYTGPGGPDEHHHPNWETLRTQQKVALQLPNVGLASGYDVGEWNDLHPQGKRIVGERLARLAYRIAYQELLPPNMFELYNLAKPVS